MNAERARQFSVIRLECKRLERPRSIAEHLACPYCFGGKGAIEAAEHARFCDFEPSVDPVCFGFPQTHGRHTSE